jgi:hypothetical protein
MIHTSSMPIIGHVLARISALTPTFVITRNSTRAFVPLHQRLQNFQCSLKICLIIGVHESLLKPIPPIRRLIWHTANAFCLPLPAMVKRRRLPCLTFPSGLVILTPLLRLVHTFLSIMKFPVWHIKPCSLVGQYTHLAEATLLQPLPPATCLSALHLRVKRLLFFLLNPQASSPSQLLFTLPWLTSPF